MKKTLNNTPTTRQRRAAKKLKEVLESHETLEGNEILTISGYSAAIAKNPKVVFESHGFKKALKELGFSLPAADMTVAKIMRLGKDENKLKATDQVYKRLGGYKQTEGGNTFNTIIFADERSKRIARRVLASSQPSQEESD